MATTLPSFADSARPTRPGRRRTGRRAAGVAAAVLLSLAASALPAQAASTAPGQDTPVLPGHGAAARFGLPAPEGADAAGPARRGLDRASLDASLDAIRKAGIYGAYSAARDGDQRWRGATGVADVATGRPVQPGMRHRIGSVTKTFTAVAVLQEVGKGRIDLDAPIGRYLPDLVPGERGQRITVRMLLNHTSGIGGYDGAIYPTLESVEANRHHHFDPRELARLALKDTPRGEPGAKMSYSNANYVIAGLLLHQVTGQSPEAYITRNVIRRAGLKHTYFPTSARISGPHSKMYESLYEQFDPPRDFSEYDMSWAGTAGAIVSTTEDLNRFFGALLGGELLRPAQLEQMRTTVPMVEGKGPDGPGYGLGLFTMDLSCGRFWGHNGLVLGSETWALSSADGRRQVSLGVNQTRRLKWDGTGPEPGTQSPEVFRAMVVHLDRAMCGAPAR